MFRTLGALAILSLATPVFACGTYGSSGPVEVVDAKGTVKATVDMNRGTVDVKTKDGWERLRTDLFAYGASMRGDQLEVVGVRDGKWVTETFSLRQYVPSKG